MGNRNSESTKSFQQKDTIRVDYSIRKNLIKEYNNRIINEQKRQELENIERKRKILEIFNKMSNWKTSKGGMPEYDIPPNSMWTDIKIFAKFERKFYEDVAAENGLQIAHILKKDDHTLLTFVCKIDYFFLKI